MHAAMPSYFTRGYVRQVQMALNEKTKMSLPTTGHFSNAWAEVLKAFQILNGLLPTAKYDEETRAELEPFIQMKYLQDTDYEEAADIVGCSKETLQAMTMTFLSGSGFISGGRCRIAFNREKFYKELGKRYNQAELNALGKKHPAIVQANGGGYLCDDYEYVRFCSAVAIDSYAAMKSTNWGMFQIPGANYRLCGYSSITAFAVDMQHSERRQLQALAKLIKATPRLRNALIARKWGEFCLDYVGAAYALYEYDVRLERNYHELTRPKKVRTAA